MKGAATSQPKDSALESAQRELREQLAALQRENAERERAEAAWTRLTAILEATPDIVGSADPDGILFYMNRAGRETLGVKSDAELEGKQFLDFQPEWAAEKIRKVSPLGQWQTPPEFAAMAVFLASDHARNITGQTINIDGGQVMHA